MTGNPFELVRILGRLWLPGENRTGHAINGPIVTILHNHGIRFDQAHPASAESTSTSTALVLVLVLLVLVLLLLVLVLV